WESFAIGGLLLAEEEIQLVNAINRAILRHFRSAYAGEGRVEVNYVDNLVVDLARRYFARPADDERHPQRGFHCSKIRSPPRATVAFPWVGRLRAVVAGEDNQ